jgi:hypothetical protein
VRRGALFRPQLLLGDQALWDPDADQLAVDSTVEYLSQYGDHSGSVGFGVASGDEWSSQTGASKPFLFDSRGPSRTLKTPSCTRGRGSRSAGLPQVSGRGGRCCGVGTDGIVAGVIGRGEVRLYRFPRADKQRPVVVLTRESAVGYLSAVTVAPITSTVRGNPLIRLCLCIAGINGARAQRLRWQKRGQVRLSFRLTVSTHFFRARICFQIVLYTDHAQSLELSFVVQHLGQLAEAPCESVRFNAMSQDQISNVAISSRPPCPARSWWSRSS